MEQMQKENAMRIVFGFVFGAGLVWLVVSGVTALLMTGVAGAGVTCPLPADWQSIPEPLHYYLSAHMSSSYHWNKYPEPSKVEFKPGEGMVFHVSSAPGIVHIKGPYTSCSDRMRKDKKAKCPHWNPDIIEHNKSVGSPIVWPPPGECGLVREVTNFNPLATDGPLHYSCEVVVQMDGSWKVVGRWNNAD